MRGEARTGSTGTISESAYLGVATQVVVRTPSGTVQVFAQNIGAAGHAPARGSTVTLSWSPEATFVVDGDDAIAQGDDDEEAAE